MNNKQKCIFLDRDGTINRFTGFLRETSQMELEEHVAEAIRMINRSEYLAIIVTNQPVVARGECSVEMLDQIHERMYTLLGAEGAYVDDLYYCPHHPDKGFEGEVPALKIECDCRKPKPGLFLKAMKEYNIDPKQSVSYGDSDRDEIASRAAGVERFFRI